MYLSNSTGKNIGPYLEFHLKYAYAAQYFYFMLVHPAPPATCSWVVLSCSYLNTKIALSWNTQTWCLLLVRGRGGRGCWLICKYYLVRLCLYDIRREEGGHMPVSSPLLGDSTVTGRYTKYFPTYFYNPDIFCLPFISFLFILRSHWHGWHAHTLNA